MRFGTRRTLGNVIAVSLLLVLTSLGDGQSSPPKRAVRVIADVSKFSLDKARVGKTQTQVGAVSRGPGSKLALCAPELGQSGGSTPLFVWHSLAGDDGAKTFTLLNERGDVLFEADVEGTQFRYPGDAPALQTGVRYAWKVSGRTSGTLPDPVAFDVTGKRPVAKAGEDPLEKAQEEIRAGLWYDALATLAEGLAAHPGDKDLAEQMQVMYRQVAPGCAAR